MSLPAAGGSYVRTVTLQKGTLEDSISATGTVQSSDVSNVTTDLKYTVKTVNVQLGDSVEEGDVICTLDTSELEESIQKLQESLADAKAEAQKQYEKAQASLTEAEENVKSTYDDMKEAEDERDSAKSAYETAAAAVKGYQAEVDAANADLLTKLNARQAALNAYTCRRRHRGRERRPGDLRHLRGRLHGGGPVRPGGCAGEGQRGVQVCRADPQDR